MTAAQVSGPTTPRSTITLLLAALLLASPCGAVRVAQGGNPVSRVVALLQGLQEKVTAEGKAEEKLLDKFICWATSTIAEKKATNVQAASRLDTLNKYVSDLDTGRIELTSERVNLERDVREADQNMMAAKAMREREQDDYQSARREIEQAIAALKAAIEVLTTATQAHTDGVLLGIKGRLESGLSSQTAEAVALSHAVEIGQRFLTKGDALFLQRLLTGQVPKPEWKQLNKAATFKKSYKARSFKIQDILAKLLQTFQKNLDDAIAKEDAAAATYSNLMTSKGGEKSTAQDALSRLDGERGAAGLSKASSQDEITQLNTQVSDNERYIAEVTAALTKKRAEWGERKSVRASELEAISKAIAILHSDDARDLFKKSLGSGPPPSLLQEAAEESEDRSRIGAVTAIQEASGFEHRGQLARLASQLIDGDSFAVVLRAVSNMLNVLRDEEASDIQTKETCETERAQDTREAAVAARKMDDASDTITRLQGDISELSTNIAGKQQQVESIQGELDSAEALRESEHAEYEKSKQEDLDAKAVIASALTVLNRFYQSTSLTQVQRQGNSLRQAPPPPPSTWDAPYGGKTEEASGVLNLLKQIQEDITKDVAKATTDEQEAQALYDETKQSLVTEQENLNSLISSLEVTKGEKEQSVQTNKAERRLKQGTLSAVMTRIKAATPGCTFFTVNFAVRMRNRQAEMDGLLRARAILTDARNSTSSSL